MKNLRLLLSILFVCLAPTGILGSEKSEYGLRSKEPTFDVKIKGKVIDQYGNPIPDSIDIGLSNIYPLYNRSWNVYYEDTSVMAYKGKFNYSVKGITRLIYEIAAGGRYLRMSDTIAIDDPIIARGQKEVVIQLQRLKNVRCRISSGSGIQKMRYAYGDTNRFYCRNSKLYFFGRKANKVFEYKNYQYIEESGISIKKYDSNYIAKKANLLLSVSDTLFTKFPANLVVFGTPLNPAKFFPIPVDSSIKDFFSFDEAPPLDQPGWVDTLKVFPSGIEKSIKYFFAYFPKGDVYAKQPQFAKVIVKPVEYSIKDLWANMEFKIVINADSASRNLVTYPSTMDPPWAQR